MGVTIQMDPLNFLTDEELLQFFHCKKTVMSCMEEPLTFLNQLRDHNLIPENLYKKVIRMTKDKRKEGVYQILDWLEKERRNFLKVFWTCVFQDHMLQQYPALRLLRNSLLDGSFKFYESLPSESEENQKETDTEKGEEKGKKVKKGGGKRKRSVEEKEDDEQPGPSSLCTPRQKRPAKKPAFSSPQKRGEQQEIWRWDFYKTQLPVSCGDKKGTLHRQKLPRGGECIFSEGKWFTPVQFEKFGGKERFKNWKLSVRCGNTALQKLIEEGHLESPHTRRCSAEKSKRVLFPASSSESSSTGTVSDDTETEGSLEQEERTGEEEDEGERADEVVEEVDPVFQAPSLPVSCGSASGVLYKCRFASGKCGKSIRTEERWFTPEEFVNKHSTLTHHHWKNDIQCHGKTLNFLIMKKILLPHSVLCDCSLCKPKENEQANDDICYMCDTEGDLVCCEECPRAFHYNCHVPSIEKEMLRGPWNCTFCVWKANQNLWSARCFTHNEVVKKPISQYTLQCEYLLLCLYKEDVQHVFTENPSATVPGYNTVISRPMWLDRIKMKLKNNEYNLMGQFVSDIRLIFQNCHTFNKGNNFGVMGSRLIEMFEREFRTVFNIQECPSNPN